jgi:hypothetical protein
MTMDRYDDKDTRHAHPTDDDTEKRAGDVLGLGGAVVPKSPADPTTEYDEESIARRRERAIHSDDTVTRPSAERSSGATGIDMGAGGSGTDIE